MITKWLPVFLLLMIPVALASDILEPAHFGEKRVELLRRLKLPLLEEGEQVIIRCGSVVSSWGRVRSTACYETEGAIKKSRKIGRALRRAISRSQIFPAKVNGEGMLIWFNFSLVYRRVDGAPQLLLLENHAFKTSELTESYIAAQRYNTGYWSDTCKYSEAPIFAHARIAADGSLLEARIAESKQSELCTDGVLDALRQSKFIPAQVNGKPVASTFMEMFYFRR